MKVFLTAILSTFLICGCTTTGTTQSIISDDTIKAMIESVNKLDKEQVKKLKEAVEEKLKDEEANKETKQTEISQTDTEVQDENKSDNGGTSDVVEVGDAFPLSNLTINVGVDSPQLIRHYTNGWTTEHPWELIKDVPITVNIDSFNSGGISLSGSTVRQGKFEDGKWERTSCFWAFDENGNELGYDDHAYTSYEQPARFYGQAKYILVVSTADFGSTFQITGRSKVMDVK